MKALHLAALLMKHPHAEVSVGWCESMDPNDPEAEVFDRIEPMRGVHHVGECIVLSASSYFSSENLIKPAEGQ